MPFPAEPPSWLPVLLAHTGLLVNLDLAVLASLAMQRALGASLSLSPSAWDLRHVLPWVFLYMGARDPHACMGKHCTVGLSSQFRLVYFYMSIYFGMLLYKVASPTLPFSMAHDKFGVAIVIV